DVLPMYFDEHTLIYHQGKFVPATQAGVNLYGQTLHYGYGVFEGIRSYDTAQGAHIFKGKEHYERLIRSSALLGIPFSQSVSELMDLSYALLEKNNLKSAYIRPLIHCPPNMGLSVPKSADLTIAAWEWGALLGEKLLRLHISDFCRPHPRSTQVEAKACGHYINSTLALQAAQGKGFDNALLLDHEGYLAESTGSNLFFEKDGILFTPERGNILPGITRATVIALCEEMHIPIEEGKYEKEAIFQADSAFLCGTAAEIIGVSSVDDYIFPKPWNLTLGKRLQTAYQQLVLEKPYNPTLAS
ncbi:MAG: branched-chain-amino-acid transaminase, partial [Bacteroidota bacterium]